MKKYLVITALGFALTLVYSETKAGDCDFYYDSPGYSSTDLDATWQDYSQTSVEVFTAENATGYVMANTWFWDPDEPGVGMNISIQRSRAGDSGFFVHGAFYTYNDDGSQAWYTVQGDYVPNSNVNDWREDYYLYGHSWDSYSYIPMSVARFQRVHGGVLDCFWGNEDSWMGEVNSRLAVTANGPVLGGGDHVSYPDYTIEAHGDIRMRFVSPQEVEIYLDGETSPSHVMERFSWHGDLKKGDADYLTEGVWHFDTLEHTYSPKGIFGDWFLGGFSSVFGAVNTGFVKFDPAQYISAPGMWDWVEREFVDQTEMNENMHFYLSTNDIDIKSASWDSLSYEDDRELFDWYKSYSNQDTKYWVMLVYDEESKTISKYYVSGINEYRNFKTHAEAFTIGMQIVEINYKMEGYLPPEDQRRISMYPSACIQCGSTAAFRKETVRRSGAHIWKIPDLGEAYEKMPSLLDSRTRVKNKATTGDTK